MSLHDETEICLIQNDYADSFNLARVSFYNVTAWPTVVGNGVVDAWPLDCLEGDFEAHAAIVSPLTIAVTEQGVGQFTAHIAAEEDVIDAAFFMVATLDEEVPGADGMTHLPHHVKIHMTPPGSGDPFTLLAGESVDISRTFVVEPDWDYELMGVAAWVSKPGRTNVSPCNGGFPLTMNEVLQSRWVPTGSITGVGDNPADIPAQVSRLAVHPNPFNPRTMIEFTLARTEWAEIGVYTLTGRRVALLAERVFAAGSHELPWNGCDSQGRAMPSGTYVIRLEIESKATARKVTLVR